MKVEIEETGPLKRRVSVVLPVARVDKEYMNFYTDVAPQLDIKGFRKGQAPLELVQAKVKERMGDQLKAEVSARLVYEGINDLVRDHELAIAGPASLVSEHKASEVRRYVGHFRFDGSFEFKVDVEVEPELDIDNYKGIEVEYPDLNTEKIIEAKLLEYQTMFADRTPIVDRTSQLGDELVVDFEGFIDGKPINGGKGEFQTIVLGQGGFIPGFEEGLVGHNSNAEVEFTVVFPDDYMNGELAGKEATFKCFIHSITEVKLHPLNDDLAQMAVYENLGALKSELQKQVEEEYSDPVKAHLLEAIMNKILADHPFEVPEAWIEAELMLTAQRLGLQSLPTDEEELKHLREVVQRVVQQNFVLDKIYAKEESIHLSANDVHQILTDEATQHNTTAEELLTMLRNTQQYEGYLSFHEHQRTINFLIENALVENRSK